jgi:hypothetical protein
MKKFLTVAGILVFCAGMGWGQNTYRWAVTNGNWNIASNWTVNPGPGTWPGDAGSGDIVIFPNGIYTVAVEADIALLASLEIGNGVILNIKTHDLNVGTLT